MKFIYGLVILLFGINATSQQTHIITGNDHFFSPDTAYVAIGDTVKLVSNGYHSITEVDSTDWVNDAATTNGGFWIGLGASTFEDWFVVNQAGKYYFNCNPHADMGMKGVLYVGSPLNSTEISTDYYKVFLDDANGLHLNYSNAETVTIYSITENWFTLSN